MTPIATSATPSPTAAPSPSASAVSPTPSPSPTQDLGPAKGTLGSTGDKSLTGPVTISSIACAFPTLNGPMIFVLGQFGKNGPALNLQILAGSFAVTVSTGAGTDFRSREFSGTGVTDFDAAVGMHIDSTVTETTAPGTATTGIGLLSSLSGSISCGDQRPGTSTLVLTATTPTGSINGGIDPVRVSCTSSTQFGLSAGTVGIAMLGTTPVGVNVFATTTGFTAFLHDAANDQYFYRTTDPTTATVTATGAQISGDAATSPTDGSAPLTIHVSGAVVCGSFATTP